MFTHMHCLVTYEQLSPVLVQQSKSRISTLKNFNFSSENIKEDPSNNPFFVPVALCLVTTSTYIDLFREILESQYSFLSEIWKSDEIPSKELISSMEFIRTSCLLLNDTINPPANTQGNIRIGGNTIQIPAEHTIGLPHTEKCIAILIDLIDIKNIILVWECLVLNQYVFFMSNNEYLLYLIFSAFNQLLFPLKWSLYIVPVLGPKLKEYLSVPVPIIIGLNSTLITMQEAINANPKASILDIDSNYFYSSSKSLLCNCQKEIISNKIQLVKAYYYVSRERFRCFKLVNLEKLINEVDFVNTTKTLVLKNSEEKEKVFISLIKHIFLDFFVVGLGDFEGYYMQDAFTEKEEFNESEFLNNIQSCNSCTMKEFWASFIESSNFQQFSEFKGKHDDSYYRRFIEIINLKAHGQYSILEKDPLFKFDLDRSISPRKILKLLNADLKQKPKNFENDSSLVLQLEIKQELRQYREYYKLEEGMSRYKQRKVSFNTNFNYGSTSQHLYYGKMGIIRLINVLFDKLTTENFKEFSLVKEYYFPYFNSHTVLGDYSWNPLVVKLFYCVKDKPEAWNIDEIIEIFRKVKDFHVELKYFFQTFCEIIDEMIKIAPDVDKKIEEIGGKIAIIVRVVKKEIPSPISRVRSTIFETKPMEGFKLVRMNTATNFCSEKANMRKNKKKISQEFRTNELI